MNIIKILKDYRMQAGLSQEQVAKNLYIGKSTYSQYETGKRNVDADMFFKIMQLYGVKIDFEKFIPDGSDYKSLLVYKDIHNGISRFQIEMWDYHPIKNKNVTLEHVNTGLMNDTWLTNKQAMVVLDFLKKHQFYNIHHINFMTYETFDFLSWKEENQHKNAITFSVSLLKRVIQKVIELHRGVVPQLDIDVGDGSPYPSICIDEDNDNETRRVFQEELEEFKYDFGYQMISYIFSNYLQKEIAKCVYEEQDDILYMIFK